MTIRVTMDIDNDTAEKIKYIAESKNITRAQAIAHAVRIAHLLLINEQRGGKSVVETPNGDYKEVVWK